MNRINFLVIFLAAFSLQGFSQFQWINPLPQGNSLKKVIFPSENLGYAFGYHGTALITVDQGAHWSILKTGTTKVLNDAYFFNENSGFAVGDSGTIIMTEDQGDTWTVFFSGIYEELYAVHFTDYLHGYACGQNGTIIRTNNGGHEWNICACPVTTNLYSIDFTNDLTGYIAGGEGPGGGNGYVLKTMDAGMNWNLMSSDLDESLYSVAFTDTLTGYAAGNFSYITKTIDGGATWTSLDNPNNHLSAHIRTITFVDTLTGYTCDVQGHVMKTIDAGTTWSNLNTNTSSILFSIGTINNNSTCAVGVGGITLVTDDNGSGFIQTSSGTRNSFYSINKPDADHLFILGDETLITSTDGGLNWEAKLIPELNGCMAGDFIDAQTGYGLINWGRIYKTNDGGVTWTQVYKSDKASFYSDILMIDHDLGWVAGGGGSPGGSTWGTLLKTTNGTDWTNEDCPSNRMLNKVYFKNKSQGFLLGQGELFASDDAGKSWSLVPLNISNHLIDIIFTSEDIGYMVTNENWQKNQIMKTLDGGHLWKIVYEDNLTGWSNYLRSVHFITNESGYAVGNNGNIVSTQDGGSSWIVQSGITNNRLHAVLMTDDSSGYIVGGYGTFLSFGNNNTGIPDFFKDEHFGTFCYPNPFIDIIHFELYSNKREEINIEIYDINGRMVFTERMSINLGLQTIELNSGDRLNSGTYFYRIKGEGIFNSGKIIKAK